MLLHPLLKAAKYTRSVFEEKRVNQQPLILLIENDDSDVFLFRRALSRCGFHGDVRVVDTAWRARNYLEGHAEFKDRDYYRVPQLIVSDLHLPGATGVEFVEWLRNHPTYRHIPLVLWSGSMPSNALQGALDKGASTYVQKSGDFHRLCSTIEEILKLIDAPPGESQK